jgi:hypothetical protein
MVLNIVIISTLIILIVHFSIDYLKTFLNTSSPHLDDLKYKKYKAIIDDISKPVLIETATSDTSSATSSDNLGPTSNPILGATSSDTLDPELDLESYFQTKLDMDLLIDSP